jgi:hypothetical protein
MGEFYHLVNSMTAQTPFHRIGRFYCDPFGWLPARLTLNMVG